MDFVGAIFHSAIVIQNKKEVGNEKVEKRANRRCRNRVSWQANSPTPSPWYRCIVAPARRRISSHFYCWYLAGRRRHNMRHQVDRDSEKSKGGNSYSGEEQRCNGECLDWDCANFRLQAFSSLCVLVAAIMRQRLEPSLWLPRLLVQPWSRSRSFKSWCVHSSEEAMVIMINVDRQYANNSNARTASCCCPSAAAPVILLLQVVPVLVSPCSSFLSCKRVCSGWVS